MPSAARCGVCRLPGNPETRLRAVYRRRRASAWSHLVPFGQGRHANRQSAEAWPLEDPGLSRLVVAPRAARGSSRLRGVRSLPFGDPSAGDNQLGRGPRGCAVLVVLEGSHAMLLAAALSPADPQSPSRTRARARPAAATGSIPVGAFPGRAEWGLPGEYSPKCLARTCF
jgi:hypothetical protein